MMSSRPQKKWYVHLKPFAGLPLRPKNQGCHGASDEMHGTPFASHVSETGLVMSGVSPTSIRSTWFFRIRFWATVAARFEFDCASAVMIWTGYVLLPDLSPLWKSWFMRPITYASASPKAASGPVRGVT